MAQNSFIGGNLQRFLPGTLVSAPPIDFPLARLHPPGAALLVVWDGAKYRQMPVKLQRYLEQKFGQRWVAAGSPGTLVSPYRFSEAAGFTLAWQRVELAPPPPVAD